MMDLSRFLYRFILGFDHGLYDFLPQESACHHLEQLDSKYKGRENTLYSKEWIYMHSAKLRFDSLSQTPKHTHPGHCTCSDHASLSDQMVRTQGETSAWQCSTLASSNILDIRDASSQKHLEQCKWDCHTGRHCVTWAGKALQAILCPAKISYAADEKHSRNL